MLKTLATQIKEYRLPAILSPVFIALEVFTDILIPFIVADLIDLGIEAHSMENILRYGLRMLAAAFLALLFGVLSGIFASRAATGFSANLRDAMFENIQTFSFSNIDKFSPAGLITRMTTDVTNIQNAFMMLIRIAVRAPLSLVTSLVMCILINRRMSLIFLVALVILSIALSMIIRRATKVFTEVFEKYDDLNASVQENVSAIRVVKAFVREDYEDEKFQIAAGNLYRLFVKAEKLIIMNMPIMNLVVYGSIIAISWFGAHFIVAGDMTTGNLTSFFSYVMSVLMSLMMLSMIFVMLTMSSASAKRVAEVLDEKTEITSPDSAKDVIPNGRIDFNDVDFAFRQSTLPEEGDAVISYDEAVPLEHDTALEDTLHDVTFHIASGETIGIIGPTGCGKSSLVSLISRLYDVSKGSVCVGGRNVKEYDLTALRDAVSVVLQKNVLFSGTILDNLRWGKKDATLEECKKACRLACADEFIESFPDGYDTVIDAGGTNVSGGQRQRLCIARALLKSPKILILDDSTSACDTATDAKIRSNLKEYIPETTKIIISQRISSLRDADRILVMEEGRVVAFDTHETLLKENAVYADIYETQMQAGGDFDKPE